MSSNDNQWSEDEGYRMMRVAYLFPREDVGGAEIATIRFIDLPQSPRSKYTRFGPDYHE